MTAFRRGQRALVLLAGAALVWPGVSSAAGAADKQGQAEILRALDKCRSIAEANARLACFDQTSAALVQAEASGDVVVVDRQQVQAAKKQAFGFNLPSLSMFDRGPRKQELTTVSDVVASATQRLRGAWEVTLESGATWVQTDTDELSRDPKPGSKVVIRKAALGSFMMTVDGQPAIRVSREH